MSLTHIDELMRNALDGGYAVGYFESWNLESLQGVIDAAEETRSPVIIGFSGDFLSRPDRRAKERLSWYAALGRAAAGSASVPCALIFNECGHDDWIREAILLGFNVVGIADQQTGYDDYADRVAELTRFAHSHGVHVEAEIGVLPCGASGEAGEEGSLTDPDLAASFVELTNIDLLAVSVGNIHVMIDGERRLNLTRLQEIGRRASIPFVLHGGSGIASGSLRSAISMGVAKVNYGTYLKQRYLTAVRTALNVDQLNPHLLLGVGGAEDVMVSARLAVRDAVLERIELLGCCGRADHA